MIEFDTKKAIKIFKALSNETRLKILEALYLGEGGMCKIREKVKKPQPSISNQLSKLQALGLIESRKEGTKTYFRIVDDDLKKILKIIIKKQKK